MWKDTAFHYFVILFYDIVYRMVKTKSKTSLCLRTFSLLTIEVCLLMACDVTRLPYITMGIA